jgi:hypothetical protein
MTNRRAGPLPYQVDQSNKIERSGDTVLALSNDQTYTIRIPAREKRATYHEKAEADTILKADDLLRQITGR